MPSLFKWSESDCMWSKLPDFPATYERDIQHILVTNPHKQKCFLTPCKTYHLWRGLRYRRWSRKRIRKVATFNNIEDTMKWLVIHKHFKSRIQLEEKTNKHDIKGKKYLGSSLTQRWQLFLHLLAPLQNPSLEEKEKECQNYNVRYKPRLFARFSQDLSALPPGLPPANQMHAATSKGSLIYPSSSRKKTLPAILI